MYKSLLVLLLFGFKLAGKKKGQQKKILAWEQVLPEFQNEVAQVLAQADNLPEALVLLKKITIRNKQYISSDLINAFLDAVLERYPGQEIRIARLFNTALAQEWLKSKGYAFTDQVAMGVPLKAIESRIQKGDVQSLKKDLDEGYLPTPRMVNQAIYHNRFDILKLLIAYGAKLDQPAYAMLHYQVYYLTPLEYVKKLLYLDQKLNAQSSQEKFLLIKEYLECEGGKH